MADDKPRKLTEKQRRFVEAYMGDARGNSTEAARLAGYKGNSQTLAAVGTENLRKPSIAIAIKERVDGDPLIAGRDEIQRFWSKLMRGEAGDESRPVATEHEIRASENLAKTQGMYVSKHELTGKDGKAIEHKHSAGISDRFADEFKGKILGVGDE